MWAGIRELGRLAVLHWPGLAALGGATGALWLLGLRMQARAGRRRSERRIEEELTAYARLDLRMQPDGDVVGLAARVSQLMAEKSPFHRTAILVRDLEAGFTVAASVEMDDSTVQSLNAWGAGVGAVEFSGGIGGRRGEGGLGARAGARSFVVVLAKEQAASGCRRVVVMPLWAAGGRMLGALVVGADGVLNVRRSVLAKALEPLEALAFKVQRALEDVGLAKRLMRAEKLAGLGMMASGMAYALNNPLTAVLGFAELIADTTGEERVKEDAAIIVREAQRMRQTLESLTEFWRPGAQSEVRVDVVELVRGLAKACAEELESRGVRLVVQAGARGISVRGNRDRLRQMMEHLLNNAAQALGAVKAGGEQVIRIAVSQRGAEVHLVVSDTGPGFREPGRVFELGETMRGAGLGLSICYGVVHEHGGQISAFNLHPHGAGVAVELPVADFEVEKLEVGEGVGSVSV